MLNVIMLNVIMLNVIMLNVITLNAITLIVAALIREIVTIRECFELTRGLYYKTFYGRNLRISVIS